MSAVPAPDLRDPRAVRQRIRRGEITGHTSGLAPGCVQGNVASCRARSPTISALLPAQSQALPGARGRAPGDPSLPTLRADLDMRTDVPRYRVFRDGVPVEEVDRHPPPVARRPRHLHPRLLVFLRVGAARRRTNHAPHRAGQERADVPHRRATRSPAGSFRGPLVVSMRPFTPADAIRAIVITSRYPRRARRAGAHRPAGPDRHRRPRPSVGGRRGRGARGRTAAILGLRRHAAVGGAPGAPEPLHHARARLMLVTDVPNADLKTAG